MNTNKSHQKARGIAFLILAVFLIAFGVMAFAGMQQEQAKYEAEGTRDFNLLSADELAGKPYVEGRIEFVFEVFAEEYTTNLGIRVSKNSDKLYYLIPLVLEDGYIDNFVALEATKRYCDTLDKIYEETWDETLPAVVTELYLEDAQIKPLPSDIEAILYDWCENGEFYQNGSFVDWCIESDFFGTSNSAKIVSHVQPYMIVPDSKPGNSAIVGLIMAGIGAALLVAAILMLRKAKRTPAAAQQSAFVQSEAAAHEAPLYEAPAPEAAPVSTAYCPACGAALEPGTRFCPACGTQVKDPQ